MAYNLFRSDDVGAPDSTGVLGSFITLLDALLVDGYNSQSITGITRSGTTATATKVAHGFRDYQRVTIAGANETDYNGDFVISNVTADTFDYTVSGSPATPATGTITGKVTPLGWTKAYTGTNTAAYRMGAACASGAGTFQGYLRVDHNTNATYVQLRGYATMSDVDTGTFPFPTVAQSATGRILLVSTTSSSQVRPWVFWGHEKGFYFKTFADIATDALVPQSGSYDSPHTQRQSMYFGGFESFLPTDAYNGVLIAPSSVSGGDMLGLTPSWTALNGNIYGCADYSGTGATTFAWNNIFNATPGAALSQMAFWPSAITGGVPMSKDTMLYESVSGRFTPRGKLHGITVPGVDLISTTRRYFDIFGDGTDWYLCVPCANTTNTAGALFANMTNPDAGWSLV